MSVRLKLQYKLEEGDRLSSPKVSSTVQAGRNFLQQFLNAR
ncbi:MULTISPECIES: hypothetical protein [Cyanophyceae]|nr:MULTISPECIES: hypothetical protein [Cyanophyceae]